MATRKVLHLRSSGAMLGAEAIILMLAEHSSQFGFQSVLGVTHDLWEPVPELVDAARRRGIETRVFPARWQVDPRTFRDLRRYCRTAGIDLVHSHGYRTDITSLLSAHGLPRVATNHLWKTGGRRLAFYATADSFALRLFPMVVGVSTEIVATMVARGIPRERLRYIPSGIDPELFVQGSPDRRASSRQELGAAEDSVLAVMVSSLTPEKGHRWALGALAAAAVRSPALRLIVVGGGPLRQELEARAAELGISGRVLFTGPRRDIPRLLEAADVFLMTSTQEGLPIALLEAMAAGKPSICSAVGEIPTVLEGGVGLLVGPRNVPEIAAALTRIAEDAGARDRMGAAARARVVSDYSARRMTERYCALYRELLEPAGRRAAPREMDFHR